ncbi:hypothetical protein Back11_24070 [Paenibacillus baekrokdamisoli]|uniref:Uncharacterized protein n=1 Tax=Paenibacillus baekrokdamisoli TaxID=1712516 RepID=A0A3G9IRY3_9BACL|nr:aspartyl-phosphate phosphatase Spo0E family protein [Paenibacillus baekrokdamisoli]MBB3069583.1 hypothetical protein [Paenibacillus baekrokdamisoli]BBH21062.1 hypothetical protein Back11_24070 [Paenibacillus baekrokdamisoli]
MDNQTYHRMERLRGQLVAAAMRKQTFLHTEVLLLSQTLDQIIVKVQTEKCKAIDASKENEAMPTR